MRYKLHPYKHDKADILAAVSTFNRKHPLERGQPSPEVFVDATVFDEWFPAEDHFTNKMGALWSGIDVWKVHFGEPVIHVGYRQGNKLYNNPKYEGNPSFEKMVDYDKLWGIAVEYKGFINKEGRMDMDNVQMRCEGCGMVMEKRDFANVEVTFADEVVITDPDVKYRRGEQVSTTGKVYRNVKANVCYVCCEKVLALLGRDKQGVWKKG